MQKFRRQIGVGHVRRQLVNGLAANRAIRELHPPRRCELAEVGKVAARAQIQRHRLVKGQKFKATHCVAGRQKRQQACRVQCAGDVRGKIFRRQVQPRIGLQFFAAAQFVEPADGQLRRAPDTVTAQIVGVDFFRVQIRQPQNPREAERLRVRPITQRRIQIGGHIGGRGNLRRRLQMPGSEPRRPHGGRAGVELHDEGMRVARVAVERDAQLRLAGEFDFGERVQKILQRARRRAPVAAGRGGKHCPFAGFQRMRDRAGQGNFDAGKIRPKVVERPDVVRLEAQFGLEIQQRERIGG